MAKNTKAPLPNPLDETTSHSTKPQTTAAKSLVIPLAGEGTIAVAYHTGPTEIGFCGNRWKRDEAQTITMAEWHAMQLRANFKHYNFTEEK